MGVALQDKLLLIQIAMMMLKTCLNNDDEFLQKIQDIILAVRTPSQVEKTLSDLQKVKHKVVSYDADC